MSHQSSRLTLPRVAPLRNKIRVSLRWLSLAAVSVVAPKCVLCLGLYAGISSWLGLQFAGREVCSTGQMSIRAPELAGLAALGLLSGLWVYRRCLGRIFAVAFAQREKGRPSLSHP